MRRCLVLQGNRTSSCLVSSRRLYVTCDGRAQDTTVEEHGPKDSLAAPTAGPQVRGKEVNTSANDHAVRLELPRSPRPSLPLSPLMDPIYLAAKEKYRLPKLPPSKEPTPFQQQLAKNPYAQALATPVRMCSLTRISLPSFFLQDFEIVTHPDTREPWYLPRSLVSSHQPLPSPSSEASKSLRPQSARPTTFGSKSYTLSRMSLLHAMHVQRSGYDNGHRNFPMPNIKQSRAFQKYDIKFREDTDTFVLELMRRRTVERMKYLCDLKRGYLVSCKAQEGGEMAVGVWEDAKMKKGTAAMLWLGPIAGSKGEDIAEPGEFSTLDVEKELKCKIPVHNLPRLLGPTYVEDLRRYAPHMFGAEVVVLKHRRLTVDLQLRLWKLQGYLATFEPFLY